MRVMMMMPVALAALVFDSVFAAPTALNALKTRFGLESRAEANTLAPTTVGLYLCTDADWEGDCQLLTNGPGLCINLDSKFAGKVTAAGPNKDISGCTLFEEENCSGLQMSELKYPGESNLAASPQGGKFNDFFKSYICY